MPPAPALEEGHRIDFNIFRSSARLISATMHIRRLFLAIISISFFWTIGAVLFIQFPPLVKNVLTSDRAVASLFLGIFSIGVAIGSVLVNRLLKGEVSARYSTPAVLLMGLFVVAFHLASVSWVGAADGSCYDIADFMPHPRRAAARVLPARHRRLRRHVRGAALRLPDHDRAQIARRRAPWRPTISSIRARWCWAR